MNAQRLNILYFKGSKIEKLPVLVLKTTESSDTERDIVDNVARNSLIALLCYLLLHIMTHL